MREIDRGRHYLMYLFLLFSPSSVVLISNMALALYHGKADLSISTFYSWQTNLHGILYEYGILRYLSRT